MIAFLAALPSVLAHNLRVLLYGPTAADRAPLDDEPQPRSLTHQHVWGSCKWNGQYWYARCVALESCTARIAC